MLCLYGKVVQHRALLFSSDVNIKYKSSAPRAADAARYARARKMSTNSLNVKGAERRGP